MPPERLLLHVQTPGKRLATNPVTGRSSFPEVVAMPGVDQEQVPLADQVLDEMGSE